MEEKSSRSLTKEKKVQTGISIPEAWWQGHRISKADNQPNDSLSIEDTWKFTPAKQASSRGKDSQEPTGPTWKDKEGKPQDKGMQRLDPEPDRRWAD